MLKIDPDEPVAISVKQSYKTSEQEVMDQSRTVTDVAVSQAASSGGRHSGAGPCAATYCL